MFGLSPLSQGHPLGFQPKWVRPSTGSYPRFSLPWDSSPGFASTACDSNAILKARSRCGSLHSLTSPHTVTRWLILQKARRHPGNEAPAARGRAVSGAVSLPSRGAFHLSLTVLVHYRSQAVFSLGGWSPRLRAAFHVCGPTREPGSAHPHVSPTGLVPLFGRPFQAVRLHGMVTARTCEHPGCPAPQPPGGNASPLIHSPGFGLGALSLAATRAISVDFSSSAYLDVSVRRVVLRTLMDLGCG